MGYYFDDRESSAWLYDADPKKNIMLLATRYMGDNPAAPFVWRSWDTSGISCDRKARYIFDFDTRFPHTEPGKISYAAGDLYCSKPHKASFVFTSVSPLTVWLNGEKIYTSSGPLERCEIPSTVPVSLKSGYNRFVLKCECTVIGFGCSLQNASPQWDPCNFVLPFTEREGEAGFLYTCPMDESVDITDSVWEMSEVGTGVQWLPSNGSELNNEPGSFYAWTVWNNHEEHSMVLPDDIRQCLVDTDSIRSCSTVLPGQHSLFLYGTLAAIRECISKLSDIHPPVHIHGRSTPYLVLGPCSINDHPQDLFQMGILHDGCAWRTDLLNVAVRPYVEVPLFGRWTYPLGVTLYGLLSAGRFLGEESYVNYVMNHMQQVTQIQEYAAWDTEKWGFAGVNQQLCWLDALDDCGSFASLTLECDRNGTDPHVRKIADHIEHYMLNEQLRLDDGTFCRRDQTIWIDDMYMSIPFLCRYSAMTGKNEPVEECIKQMFHYRNLFFMPEKKILGHMMCLIHMKNNQIPWSRGNGWVIFSLSELLMHLDPSHPQWNELLQYFITLTEGYLRLQDENGLWHQILDEPGTYPESSSTAMFICAFCRGLRFRWYPKEMLKQIEQAAMKAWKGLTRYTIDRHGNLYGVCQGSGCSFSRAYYRSLMWNFNDTHGIGIVILAGVEILKLQEEAESEPDMLPTAYFLSTD